MGKPSNELAGLLNNFSIMPASEQSELYPDRHGQYVTAQYTYTFVTDVSGSVTILGIDRS